MMELGEIVLGWATRSEPVQFVLITELKCTIILTAAFIILAILSKSGPVKRNLLAKLVMILKTLGHKIFEDAALAAARKCKWSPALKYNKPIAVWVTYSIRFTLRESQKE